MMMKKKRKRQSSSSSSPRFQPTLVRSCGLCPDCDADAQLTRDPDHPRVWRLQIQHDHTCPTYRRLRADGRAS